MLAIQPSSPQKTTPNLLPLRINHAGPVPSAAHYWKPTTTTATTTNDSATATPTQHVHFRSRHLHGTPIRLPTNYTGAILHITDKQLPVQQQPQHDNADDDDDDESTMPVQVKIADQVGVFEEVVVWGHGEEVNVKEDRFGRGIEEWIGWAECVHGDGEEEEEEEGKEEKKG